MFHFLAGQAMGLAIGFVAGAFCPAVLRKIKGLFVKEAAVVKGDVSKYGADLKKKY